MFHTDFNERNEDSSSQILNRSSNLNDIILAWPWWQIQHKQSSHDSAQSHLVTIKSQSVLLYDSVCQIIMRSHYS